MRGCSLPAVLVLAGLAACSSRPRLPGGQRDAAPAVVIVDRPAASALADLPMVDEREPNDSPSGAQPLESGKVVRGTLGPVDGGRGHDVDFYALRFEAVAGELAAGTGVMIVRLALEGAGGAAAELLDGEGRRLAATGEGARRMIANYGVVPGKSYLVRVFGRGEIDPRAPYRLAVALAPLGPGEEIEPNDSEAQATPLEGRDATGYFGAPGDADWLRFSVPGAAAGMALKLEVGGVEEVGFTLRVVGEEARPLATARAPVGEGIAMRNAPWGGEAMSLLLRADKGANVAQRWLLHAASEPIAPGVEVEPNDSVEAAGRLQLVSGAAERLGYLWPGDIDLHLVQADAAGALALDLEPPSGSRVDLKLEVLAAGGKGKPRLRVDDAGAGQAEALRNWFVDAGGTVLLRVAARSRDVIFDAPYRLAVRLASAEGTEREPNGDRTLATTLAPGQVMRGAVSPRGDEDWFELKPPPGASRVTVRLAEVPAGMTPQLRLMGERSRLASASAASLASDLRGGRVWTVVRDVAGKSTPLGSYALEVEFE